MPSRLRTLLVLALFAAAHLVGQPLAATRVCGAAGGSMDGCASLEGAFEGAIGCCCGPAAPSAAATGCSGCCGGGGTDSDPGTPDGSTSPDGPAPSDSLGFDLGCQCGMAPVPAELPPRAGAELLDIAAATPSIAADTNPHFAVPRAPRAAPRPRWRPPALTSRARAALTQVLRI